MVAGKRVDSDFRESTPVDAAPEGTALAVPPMPAQATVPARLPHSTEVPFLQAAMALDVVDISSYVSDVGTWGAAARSKTAPTPSVHHTLAPIELDRL